jgi:hypothetical protein
MTSQVQHSKTVNLGLLALLFLFGLIVYLVRQGGQIQQIDMPGGGSVKFGAPIAGPEKAEETSSSELKARQADLEEKMRRLDEQLSARALDPSQGGSGPVPATPAPVTPVVPPPLVNLAGNWQGTQGYYSFFINQSGPALTFQWVEPLRGLIAVGQGQLQGQDVQLFYNTAFGTQGVAQLHVTDSGQELIGGFRDLTTGYQGQLFLTR